MTREQAAEAIKQIGLYLKAQQDAYAASGAAETHENWDDDPQHWNDAADWCHVLLRAAARDGWHACQLCRG